MIDLDHLSALEAAATPGPWSPDIDDPGTPFAEWTGKLELPDGRCALLYEPGPDAERDLRFICAIRSVAPQLLALARAAVEWRNGIKKYYPNGGVPLVRAIDVLLGKDETP